MSTTELTALRRLFYRTQRWVWLRDQVRVDPDEWDRCMREVRESVAEVEQIRGERSGGADG